ncbi:hypothetical protein PYCC9005_005892 [Savitreella phatthalungensis]
MFALRRSFATAAIRRNDKSAIDKAAEKVKEVAGKFKADGEIGSKFTSKGEIGQKFEKDVGGAFSKDGAIGKQFEKDGAIGGTGQKAAEKAQEAANEVKK